MKKLEFTTLVFATFLVMFTIGKIGYETVHYGTGWARAWDVMGFAGSAFLFIASGYLIVSVARFLYVLADKPKSDKPAVSHKWHHSA